MSYVASLTLLSVEIISSHEDLEESAAMRICGAYASSITERSMIWDSLPSSIDIHS